MGVCVLNDGTELEFDEDGNFLDSVTEEQQKQWFKEEGEREIDPGSYGRIETEFDPESAMKGTGPLIPSKPLKEWILIYGASGSAKTHSALSCFQLINSSNSPAHFFAIDTDFAVEMNLENFPELMNSGKMHIETCADFGEIQKATDKILKQVRPDRGDWILVDKISDAWALAPEFYVRSRLGIELDDLEKRYRASGKSGKDFQGGNALLEYYAGGITPMYRTWEQQILYRSKCHIFCTSGETAVISGTGRMDDSATMKNEFGKLKPNCNKETPFKFHTRLNSIQPYENQWVINTKRERRARKYLKRERINDFGLQYLVEVAGWIREK